MTEDDIDLDSNIEDLEWEKLHPWYGPCDATEHPYGTCYECSKLIYGEVSPYRIMWENKHGKFIPPLGAIRANRDIVIQGWSPSPSAGLTWADRIKSYTESTGYPRSLFVADDGRLVGTWIMGNNYRVKSSFYGGYPATYLERVKALFPEKKKVLHLFSGKVDLSIVPGDTVDINPDHNPTYLDDAQSLERVPLEDYDIFYCDTPYSVEDCDHYQTSMVKRNKVFRALQRTKPGTHICWLDQVLPMWRKDFFSLVGVVGIVKSTNHRFRVLSIFERIEGTR